MAFVPSYPCTSSSASRLHGDGGGRLRCARVPTPAPPASRPPPPSRSATPTEMKKGGSRYQQPLRPRRPDDPFKAPEDGTPIFAISVRSPRTKIWYPLGAVPGDKRSKTLVDALKTNWGRAIYQTTLDKGIAQTVYGKDRSRLLQTALRQYPQLKQHERNLEFGYKISAKGLENEKTRAISSELALPFFQWAKMKFNSLFSSAGNTSS